MSRHRGFTLIELLIVVAIIAILAAIAVPNFLEAQVRAKVSRVKSDQRTITTALESYRIDNTKYPPDFNTRATAGNPNVDFITVRWGLFSLTTPVAYLADLPGTTFINKGSRGGADYNTSQPNMGSQYENIEQRKANGAWFTGMNANKVAKVGGALLSVWMLRDAGPDGEINHTFVFPYDPTNGTVSNGDIFRFGP